MKKNEKDSTELTTDELTEQYETKKISPSVKFIGCGVVLLITTLVVLSFNSYNKLHMASIEGNDEFSLATAPIAATDSRKDVISIPSGVVKANPFLPYRRLGNEIKEETLVNDVPKFDLVAPPDFNESGSEVAKIMDTVVSGILFDKYSPSAILNIEGNDYLVKKGDVIHNYKVINIAQNSVTVQLGKNTYQAGIGELLTEGSIKHNDISNLNKKFGGEQR